MKRIPLISSDLNPPTTDTATGDSDSTAMECPLCQLPLGSDECFHSHTEIEGVGYKCRVCDYVALLKTAIKQHLRKHTGEKPFSCPHCTYRASDHGSVNTHIGSQHGGNYL